MREWGPSLVVVPFGRIGFGVVAVGSGDDFNVGAIVERGSAGGDDLLASGDAGQDLGEARVGDAGIHGGLVSDAVGADDHDGGFAGAGDHDGFRGDDEGFGRGAASDGDVDGGAGAESAFGIFEADPDFDGGAAGIEGGADEGDFAGDGIGQAGNGDGGGIALFSNCACVCDKWIFASSAEVSMTVMRGAPEAAVSPA